jgi:uncharacterized protein YecE (DUF72 family)
MLFVGQASLQGDIARYAQHFNLLELHTEPGRLPKPAGLRKWVDSVGDGFAFSLRVPAKIWSADDAESETLIDYVHTVAGTLKPAVCLLQTPATATPTARNKARIAELCQRLRKPETLLAWEPRGIWQADELEELADSLDVLLVRDLSRDEEVALGSTVYTRLLALGDATHVRSGVAFDVAEKLADSERAFVVMEGTGAKGAAKIMRENLEDATG